MLFDHSFYLHSCTVCLKFECLGFGRGTNPLVTLGHLAVSKSFRPIESGIATPETTHTPFAPLPFLSIFLHLPFVTIYHLRRRLPSPPSSPPPPPSPPPSSSPLRIPTILLSFRFAPLHFASLPFTSLRFTPSIHLHSSPFLWSLHLPCRLSCIPSSVMRHSCQQ